MSSVYLVIVTGATFGAAGFFLGIGVGVDSIKRSLNRRLKRFHSDDELSVQLIKELIEEA
jgi:hypothetical protein